MKQRNIFLIMLLCLSVLAACTKESNDKTSNAGATTPTGTVTTLPEGASKVESQNSSKEGTSAMNGVDNPQIIDKIEVTIAALKGPTAIGMVKVMEEASEGKTTNNYNFTIAGTADEISAGLVKGDFDIAAIPCNLASVLYNKTQGGIKIAGINTLGVLYIVETGDTIHSVADLKGKTIYATGLGTVPQYTLNNILQANGIDPEEDLTIEYKTEPTEVAAMLSETENAIAMLPQPYVTTVLMNNEMLRIALDVDKEWKRVSDDGSSVVTGVVVVRSEFLEKNREAFEAFMSEYEDSAIFVNEEIDEASTLVEKFDIFKAAPVKMAIPYCNITLIQGEEMKEKVSGYLAALFDQNPKSIGGKLPANDFYIIP